MHGISSRQAVARVAAAQSQAVAQICTRVSNTGRRPELTAWQRCSASTRVAGPSGASCSLKANLKPGWLPARTEAGVSPPLAAPLSGLGCSAEPVDGRQMEESSGLQMEAWNRARGMSFELEESQTLPVSACFVAVSRYTLHPSLTCQPSRIALPRSRQATRAGCCSAAGKPGGSGGKGLAQQCINRQLLAAQTATRSRLPPAVKAPAGWPLRRKCNQLLAPLVPPTSAARPQATYHGHSAIGIDHHHRRRLAAGFCGRG